MRKIGENFVVTHNTHWGLTLNITNYEKENV